jgi:branched-chain amino acid transport system substrate-binding protein
MRVRAVAAIAVVVVGAGALTACGKNNDSASADAASGSGSSGKDTKPLVIGMTIEKTGPLSVLGPTADGAQAAVDYLNANGGAGGRKVKLVVKDNASDSSRAIQSVTELAQSGAAIIVGPSFVQDCAAITETVAQTKVPEICTSPSDLTAAAPPYQYGIGPSTHQEDQVVYKELAKETKKVGTMAATDRSGDQAAEWAKEAEKDNGITIQVERTDASATTFKPQLQKMMSKGVGAMYFTSCGNISITAAGEAVALGFKGKIVLINCFASQGVAKAVKGFANGNVVTPAPEFMLEPPYTEARQAANELYNKEVGTKEVTTADGWDAVMLAAKAVEKAGSTDPEAINKVLEDSFSFTGTWAGGTFTAQDHRGQSTDGVLVFAEYTKSGDLKRAGS